MNRKHTILLLVLTLVTTLLAPARFGFACEPIAPTSHCPMMAAMRKTRKSACCANEKEVAKRPSLSSRCCCNLKPAPEAPRLPEASLVGETMAFVPGPSTLCLPVLEAMGFAQAIPALDTTAPRGPPLPLAPFRAPPTLS